MWIPAPNCSGCAGKHIYHSAASSTYVPNGTQFLIRYESGPVSGIVSQDSVSLGGIVATKALFAEVVDVSGLGLAYLIGAFDGICGLAFRSISVDDMEPVLPLMFDQGVLDNPYFGVFLETTGQNGELFIGGYDEKHIVPGHELTWIDLTSETYWEIQMNSLDVGGKPATTVTRAVLDTGTSLLAGPVAEVDALLTSIGCTRAWEQGGGRLPHAAFLNGEYTIPCNKVPSLPNVTITIATGVGTQTAAFTLTGADYVINVEDIECLCGFIGVDIPAPAGPLWCVCVARGRNTRR